MKDPTVSVLMPVYNGERYLKEAVESVLGQEFGDFELLITDDASTDGTADLLAALAGADRRITVFRQAQNAGPAVALEQMTRRARGEFLARSDADDASLPGRFRAQVARLRQDPEAGVLGTWVRSILADGQPYQEERFPDDDAWIKRKLERGRNVIVDGTLMFRRSLLARLGAPVWRFRYGQSFDLLLRLAGLARFGFVEEVLYLWRWRPEGMRVAAMQDIRGRIDRVILDLHALRSKGLPEFDWRKHEQEILSSRPEENPAILASWEHYRQGRSDLLAGRVPSAREHLGAAMMNPKLRRKSSLLLFLARLPGGVGKAAGRAIERMGCVWDSRLRYVRNLSPEH